MEMEEKLSVKPKQSVKPKHIPVLPMHMYMGIETWEGHYRYLQWKMTHYERQLFHGLSDGFSRQVLLYVCQATTFFHELV